MICFLVLRDGDQLHTTVTLYHRWDYDQLRWLFSLFVDHLSWWHTEDHYEFLYGIGVESWKP